MMRFFIFLSLLSVLFAKEPITPIPKKIDFNLQKALLGKVLFHDPSLSRDGTISCASCHNLQNGGDDGKRVSTGVFGRKGIVNAPTVYNARFHFRQFCNGRAKDLYEQAKGPLFSKIEMDMTPKLLIERVSSNPFYRKKFKELYKDSTITLDMIIDAIVEFEKALITPNSKFDRYLRGETKLSPKEQKGYLLFKELGCVSCHNGINVGGNSFQKMGIIHPYSHLVGDRYSLTKQEADRGIYKVPTLRNIALTAPYMHDGSIKTLREAIDIMAYHNLGFHLEPQEIDAIEAFLKTLTGKIPKIAQ